VKNAFRAVSSNTSGILRVGGTGVTGQDNTLSVWAKSNTGGEQKFRFFANGNTTTSSDFTATTEWQRFDYTYNCTFVTAGIKGASSELSDILFYGFQHEAGSYPTSYIPNHSGGSVTRGADLATILNQSGVIGQTEGTIFFDAYFDENDKVNFSISDGTSSNFIAIDTTGANSVFARITQGGASQAEINTSTSYFTAGQRLKCAIAYNANDFVFYINGTQIGTDSSGSVPACDDIRFARYNGALAAAQKVNKTLLFDTRLSNTDLETLTTL